MAMFDVPSGNKQPTRWKDSSYDFRLFYVYFGCMFALLAFGGSLTVRQELAIVAVLTAVLATLSLKHRQDMNWRWPGVKPKGILGAVGITVVSIVFDYAANPMGPRSDPGFLPWHLAGFGIAAFGVLNSLNVVQKSESDFMKQCELAESGGLRPAPEVETAPAAPADPLWKRAIRAAYYTFAALVWVGFMGWFYEFQVAFQHGSAGPSATKTDPLNSHGLVRYIPHSQKLLIHFLDKLGSIGVPAVIATGFILHFFLGIKIVENMPTFKEWRRQRTGKR
jgi:hypothetical protein